MILGEDMEGTTQTCTITLDKDRKVHGTIRFSGKDSLICLDSETPISLGGSYCELHGQLYSLEKVSAFDCLAWTDCGSRFVSGEHSYFIEAFPHYIVVGDRHLSSEDAVLDSASFLVDDASTLFYDHNAFGSVRDPEKYINEIIKDDKNSGSIPVGPYPIIQYFTGQHRIFEADTVLGNISAHHMIQQTMPSTEGFGVKNAIWIELKFPEPQKFHTAVDRIWTLLRFLEVCAGRPQNLLKIRVHVAHDDPHPRQPLTVFWSHAPVRQEERKKKNGWGVHPYDVLVSPVFEKDAYIKILQNWLERHAEWRDARMRFAASFSKQSSFDIDRLISAANMFDILPSSAVPGDIILSDEEISARDQCKKLFKALPDSSHRSSVLGALGRMHKSNLKRKIRHRVEFITKQLSDRLPDLALVTDEAVNCRNYFVHGGEPSFNYQDEEFGGRTIFFTLALEFVFAVSDMIQAGWDLKTWIDKKHGSGHEFGLFIVNYKQQLDLLKKALAAEPKTLTD